MIILKCAKHCFLVLQRQPTHLSDSFEEYPEPIDQQITLFRKRRNYWLVLGDLPTGTLYNNNNNDNNKYNSTKGYCYQLSISNYFWTPCATISRNHQSFPSQSPLIIWPKVVVSKKLIVKTTAELHVRPPPVSNKIFPVEAL